MAPSSRHLYPAWLRPGSARDAPAPGGHPAPARRGRPDLGAPPRLRPPLRHRRRRGAGRRRCSSSARAGSSSGAPTPNFWLAAALILPLIFRRRAPMTVFVVDRHRGLRPVARDRTGAGRRRAARGRLHRRPRVRLVPRRGGRRRSSRPASSWPRSRWTPTGNDVKSFVFLTGLAFDRPLGRRRRARPAQPARLAGRAGPAPRDRAGPAGLAGRRRGAGPHRARDARRGVAQHPGDGDPGRRRLGGTASDPARAAEAMHEVSGTGRQALTDMRRMLGVLREEPAGGRRERRRGSRRERRHRGRRGRARADQRPPTPRSPPSPACATSTHWSSGCAAPASQCRSSTAGGPSRSRVRPG